MKSNTTDNPEGKMHQAKRLSLTLAAWAIAASALTGCETKAQSGALIGGGIGAGTGALIGGTSGHAAGGAVVGGAVGAASGAIIGNEADKQDRR